VSPQWSVEALDDDRSALAAAATIAEEAINLYRDALALLEEGWQSQSGSAATDVIRRQCGEGAEVVAALRDAAAELRALRDAVECRTDPAVDPGRSRLGDRPAVWFDTPQPPAFGGAAPPVPYGGGALPQAPPAWTTGAGLPPVPPPPDLAGALAGLVARIADAVEFPGVPAAEPATTAEGAGDAPEPRGAAYRPESAAGPAAVGTPVQPPAPPPLPVPVPDPPDSPDLPNPPQAPQPPQPPLLAAERPPDPASEAPPVPVPQAPPTTDPATPCEIAADELPQVGQ